MRRVHHKSTVRSALGESTKVNPDCVGPAIPACQRGSVDLEACKCKCPWNYKGSACETCDSSQCKNHATMDTGTCKCKCVEGFSGENCGKGSKCLNGGSLTGSDCKCANGWSGPTCKACDLTCENGGTADMKNCVCKCPANRSPPDCKACQDPGCANGGIFQDKMDEKTQKPLCGCKCPDDRVWSGIKCDSCADPGCKNGAKFSKAGCKCECANENWSGSKCEKCELHCYGGKRLDDKTCTCVDPPNPNFNPCVVGCKHGTLDKATCKCTCEAGFKGIFCDECEVEKCFNGGKLRHETDCKCECKEPWQGELCKECPLDCGPHGTVKDGCSGCKCASSKSGKWTGNKCDTCTHPTCSNGGTLDHAQCVCKCAQGYSGDTCSACHLTQEWCKHGSSLVKDECKCDCSKGAAAKGDWSGQLCNVCQHQGCANGGSVNQQSCRCECVPLWIGRYCKACGHQFCKAKKSGSDAVGSNGIGDSPSDPNCNWARTDLGCPGSLN